MYKSIEGVPLSVSSNAVGVLLYAPRVHRTRLFCRTWSVLNLAVGITHQSVPAVHTWTPYIVAG